MKKTLLACITCEKFRKRADSQRETWVKDVKPEWADVRFFLAKQEREPLPDEVFLDCPDDYGSLPYKVRAMLVWALSKGYELVFKFDDDAYVKAERLFSEPPGGDYVGHLNTTPPVWISGLGYWLSKKAMKVAAFAEIPKDEWAEDRWMGGVMRAAKIKAVDDPCIFPADCTPRKNAVSPEAKCVVEFDPEEMKQVHGGPRGWEERAAMAAERAHKKLMREKSKVRRGDGSLFFQ